MKFETLDYIHVDDIPTPKNEDDVNVELLAQLTYGFYEVHLIAVKYPNGELHNEFSYSCNHHQVCNWEVPYNENEIDTPELFAMMHQALQDMRSKNSSKKE